MAILICQLLKNPDRDRDREREQKERDRIYNERKSTASSGAAKQSAVKDSSASKVDNRSLSLSLRP